jgi:hypothetical protein
MKKIFFVLALFIGLVTAKAQTGPVAQVATITQLKNYNGPSGLVFVSDSAKQGLYYICAACTADESLVYAGAGGKKWRRVVDYASLNGISDIDTTSLSNRINLKVNISDTAAALLPYLRKIDTASLSNRINLKVNISDTANALAPYLREIDTASLSNRINLKVNISDTAAALAPYLRKAEVASTSGTTDSAMVKNGDGTFSYKRLSSLDGSPWSGSWTATATSASTSLTMSSGTQVYVFNGSSTATWTLPALGTTRGLNVKNNGSANLTVQRAGSDQIWTSSAVTSITLTPGQSSAFYGVGSYWSVFYRDEAAVDTTSLSNRIDLKVNISDTAAALLPYLRKIDTASMLSPYLREIDTASLSDRINGKQASNTLLAQLSVITFAENDFPVYVSSTLTNRTPTQVKAILDLDQVPNLTAQGMVSSATVDGSQINDGTITSAKFEEVEQLDYYQDEVRALRALGAAYLYRTVSATWQASTTAQSLVDNSVRLAALTEVFRDTTITGISYNLITAGVFTADQSNGVALYSLNTSTGVLTLLGQSAADANGDLWKTTTGFRNVALSSPVAVTEGTVLYIAFLYNNSAQTTAPQLVGPAGSSNRSFTLSLPNSIKTFAHVPASNSFPSSITMSATSNVNETYLGFVY